MEPKTIVAIVLVAFIIGGLFFFSIRLKKTNPPLFFFLGVFFCLSL